MLSFDFWSAADVSSRCVWPIASSKSAVACASPSALPSAVASPATATVGTAVPSVPSAFGVSSAFSSSSLLKRGLDRLTLPRLRLVKPCVVSSELGSGVSSASASLAGAASAATPAWGSSAVPAAATSAAGVALLSLALSEAAGSAPSPPLRFALGVRRKRLKGNPRRFVSGLSLFLGCLPFFGFLAFFPFFFEDGEVGALGGATAAAAGAGSAFPSASSSNSPTPSGSRTPVMLVWMRRGVVRSPGLAISPSVVLDRDTRSRERMLSWEDDLRSGEMPVLASSPSSARLSSDCDRA
mmetsp:Transcript_29279/g.76726  ORF Transcript_29279/g.76726 Transcript_29279/m.76726 type:complete len:297 (-) Transcript_29279:371-1261(-)